MRRSRRIPFLVTERLMFDLDSAADDLVAISELPRLLPRRHGKRLNLATLYRWVSRGVGGSRLPTLRVGGRLYVHRQQLSEFLERLNAGRSSAGTTTPTVTSQANRSRARSIADAEARCRQRGALG